MDLEEMVAETTEADDALPEEVVEETEESEEPLVEEEPVEEKPEEPKATEPGWIKKRVDKAVQKALAKQQEAFDKRLEPIMAKMMEAEAKELVTSKKVADIETARELVRLRNNLPAKEEQPREPNGQYAPKEDPATNARIKMLRHQADKIKGNNGPDVINEFQTNPEIKEKVISGEMDFYDVAEYMKAPKRRPPSPVRSSNGASGTNPNAIESMSDEQFRRLEQRIKEGARIRLS